MKRRIGIGVVGCGWMGQARGRSYRRLSTLFPERGVDPELVICRDTVAAHARDAVESFGFRESTLNWRRVIEHPDVGAVIVAAPNMFHVEIIEASARLENVVSLRKD